MASPEEIQEVTPPNASKIDVPISIFGTESYQIKFDRAMVNLRKGTVSGLISLASVTPGGRGDISFTPIDAALRDAAANTLQKLIDRGYTLQELKSTHKDDNVGDLLDRPTKINV